MLLVGAFTGMVMSLQSVYAFRQFGLESFSGGVTGKAIAIELGPVLTSLMLAGRAGAGIATELGTMRISEQIDALESMAVNPIQYLVLPRLIAAMIVTPILTLLFFVIGMGGAYFVAVIVEHVDQGQWVANLRDVVVPLDVVPGADQGRVLRLHGDADRLLPGLSRDRWWTRRRHRHDARGRIALGLDARGRLLPVRHPVAAPRHREGGVMGGLDPLATRNVDEMILDACERYKVSSVVISHDMASVCRIAGADGRIAMRGRT